MGERMGGWEEGRETYKLAGNVMTVAFGQLKSLKLVCVEHWEGRRSNEPTRLLRFLLCTSERQ